MLPDWYSDYKKKIDESIIKYLDVYFEFQPSPNPLPIGEVRTTLLSLHTRETRSVE
jgi:hypothetical protein